MATQGIQGLFGGMGTPEEMQRQLTEQKALQFAQMTPQQQTSYNIYKNTGNLGRGLAGAFGVDVQDPAIKRATMLRQMASQFDTNTPEGLRQMAQALQSTDPELGFQVMQRADALELSRQKLITEQATAASKLAEKLTPEQKNAAGIADQEADRGTPEWQSAYKRELNRLTAKEGSKPTIKEVGVAEGTREPVYTYQEGSTVRQVTFKNVNGEQKMVPYTGGVDRTTAKVTATASAKGEESFSVELGKLDAKEVSNARNLREAAIGELGSLQKMQELNQQQLMSGSFATGRVGALNLLNTLGMTSGQDATKLANSEQYTKVTGDLLLDKIKKLGTNPSNTDREFIAKIVPQLENSPAARQELINYLVKKANKVVSETTRLDTYARDNKGLKGFVPEVPLVGQTPNVSSMSTEELLKIAKGQK
jgi:hypothetical protein